MRKKNTDFPEMTTTDLILQLVENYGYTKKAATSIMKDFTQVVLDNLRNGCSVSVQRLGRFDLQERAAHRGRHPVSGEEFEVPAHLVMHFIPYKEIKAMVKMYEDDKNRGLI